MQALEAGRWLLHEVNRACLTCVPGAPPLAARSKNDSTPLMSMTLILLMLQFRASI